MDIPFLCCCVVKYTSSFCQSLEGRQLLKSTDDDERRSRRETALDHERATTRLNSSTDDDSSSPPHFVRLIAKTHNFYRPSQATPRRALIDLVTMKGSIGLRSLSSTRSSILWLLVSSLCLRQSLCQDSCSSAVGPLVIGDEVIGSTLGGDEGAANSSDISLSQCGANGPLIDEDTSSNWFFVEGIAGRLKFSTCSATTNFGNRITIHHGDNCDDDSLICVTSSDEPDLECQFSNGLGVSVDVDTVPGETYYVQVHDSVSGSSGDFGLTVTESTPTPINDVCSDATEMFQNGESRVPGTTVGATVDIGYKCDRCIESGPGTTPGVWFRVLRTR